MTRLQWLACWDKLRELVSTGSQTSFGKNQLLSIMDTIERDMIRVIEKEQQKGESE